MEKVKNRTDSATTTLWCHFEIDNTYRSQLNVGDYTVLSRPVHIPSKLPVLSPLKHRY